MLGLGFGSGLDPGGMRTQVLSSSEASSRAEVETCGAAASASGWVSDSVLRVESSRLLAAAASLALAADSFRAAALADDSCTAVYVEWPIIE
jgi:hypothetical protein